MIPNEILREAAARTYERYVSDLLSDYDPEYRCEFSLNFEKKIKKLKRRAEHPVFYRSMRRIAIFILALLAAGMIWISVDPDARAAFVGWISEITGSYYKYHHEGKTTDAINSADYRPSWIPDGYSEESVRSFNDKTTVRYKNNEGILLRFSYVNTQRESNWQFDISRGHTQSCHVGEYMATLFISNTDDVASSVMWIDSYDTALSVTGFVSETDLIKIAESVIILDDSAG